MKEKIYLDQNIIGYIADKSLSFDKDRFQFVYSETHFKEFSALNYKYFCEALDSINGRCLKINLDKKFKIQDNGLLLDFIPAKQLYDDFISRYDPSTDHYLDGLLSYIFGSQDKSKVSLFPDSLDSIFDEMSDDFQFINPLHDVLKKGFTKANDIFVNLLPKINGVENNRKEMGTDKGKLNSIQNNIIVRVNDILTKKTGVDSLEYLIKQFDGKSNYEKVAGLHAFLNIVGYNPDKNLKEIGNLPNSRYDGEHIGHSIFCNYFLSEDRRLVKKASAIFEYLQLNTRVLRLQMK